MTGKCRLDEPAPGTAVKSPLPIYRALYRGWVGLALTVCLFSALASVLGDGSAAETGGCEWFRLWFWCRFPGPGRVRPQADRAPVWSRVCSSSLRRFYASALLPPQGLGAINPIMPMIPGPGGTVARVDRLIQAKISFDGREMGARLSWLPHRAKLRLQIRRAGVRVGGSRTRSADCVSFAVRGLDWLTPPAAYEERAGLSIMHSLNIPCRSICLRKSQYHTCP